METCLGTRRQRHKTVPLSLQLETVLQWRADKEIVAMKKRLLFGAIILVAIGTIYLCVMMFISSAPYRWSGKLCEAIRRGDTESALNYVAEGKDKGYSMDTLSAYPSPLCGLAETAPCTPLQAACEYCNLTVAQQLLDAGASVYPSEGGIGTGLVYIVIRNHYSQDETQLLELLIQHGAPLEDDEYDPLITDAACRSPRNFEAEPDPTTGAYPYDESVAKGITESFLLLVEHKDYYTVNGANRNALHCAVIMGNWPLAETLAIQFNFSLDAKDMNGKTAYDLAKEEGAPSHILDLLQP